MKVVCSKAGSSEPCGLPILAAVISTAVAATNHCSSAELSPRCSLLAAAAKADAYPMDGQECSSAGGGPRRKTARKSRTTALTNPRSNNVSRIMVLLQKAVYAVSRTEPWG